MTKTMNSGRLCSKCASPRTGPWRAGWNAPGKSKASSLILARLHFSLVAAAILLVIPLLAACGGDSREDGALTVFAAASLTSSFTELGEAFEDAHENVAIEFNFAGSQALATQLAEGAPADVFASANTTQMDRVAGSGRLDTEPVVFAQNRLAVLVPADNPAQVETIFDLGDPDLKLVLAAEDVPVGRYARDVLGSVEASDDFRNRYRDFNGFNIVSNETNVLQVVTRVRLGEADAGIVYETDVTPEVAGEVVLIPIPTEFNIIADYPIAAVSDGDTDLAEEFIAFVQSPEGQRILAGWGFLPVPPA